MIKDAALREAGFVNIEHIRHTRRSALRPVDRRNTMEMHDLARRRVHYILCESASERDPVEQAILLETSHLHDAVYQRSFAIELERAVSPASDAAHREIKAGGGERIELDLPSAAFQTQFRLGEVHIRELDLSLHLPRAIPGQENARDVRLNDFNFVCDPVRAGVRQECDRLVLV